MMCSTLRGSVGGGRVLLAAALVAILTASQDGGQSPPADPVTPAAPDDATPDRRNPRQVRRDAGETEGPRMVAGATLLDSADPLEFYARLEPFVGSFTVAGRSWPRPESTPNEFIGTCVGAWALDGQYLQMTLMFDLGGRRPYESIGMTWYNPRQQRFEADFYNSNGTLRSFRYGNFDEEGGATLSMMSRLSSESPDIEPSSRVEFEITDADSFTYSAWQRLNDGGWWKNFEMTCTRDEQPHDVAP
jgi:hypothetical protein